MRNLMVRKFLGLYREVVVLYTYVHQCASQASFSFFSDRQNIEKLEVTSQSPLIKKKEGA